MKFQRTLLLSASCFLMALLCFIVWGYWSDENLADRIAPRLLRFHVIANSNSATDQNIKLQVKALILEKLEQCPAGSKQELCSYIEEHKTSLEQDVNSWLLEQGYDYGASVAVSQVYFPTKAYGNMVLPCGTYDALQVTLGEGRGRNWWCVVYPRLCFIDCTHAVLPEASARELEALLTEEDFRAVMDSSPQIHIRLKLAEFIK